MNYNNTECSECNYVPDEHNPFNTGNIYFDLSTDNISKLKICNCVYNRYIESNKEEVNFIYIPIDYMVKFMHHNNMIKNMKENINIIKKIENIDYTKDYKIYELSNNVIISTNNLINNLHVDNIYYKNINALRINRKGNEIFFYKMIQIENYLYKQLCDINKNEQLTFKSLNTLQEIIIICSEYHVISKKNKNVILLGFNLPLHDSVRTKGILNMSIKCLTYYKKGICGLIFKACFINIYDSNPEPYKFSNNYDCIIGCT